MGNLELMMTYTAILSVICVIASLWINDQGSSA
jgi:hypothetical protein